LVFPRGFRPLRLLAVELLFLLTAPLCLLLLLECSSLLHASCANFVMGRFCKHVAEERLFSVVVTQDVIEGVVVVAAGLTSKKRNPHGAKLLTTDLLCGDVCVFALDLLRENALLAVEKAVLSEQCKRGLDLNAKGLAGVHNRDHNRCFICEDIVSLSFLGKSRL